ncbi:MAG TPA: DUF2490 domain-containing protein [Cytophagaceae bacterium]|jgi:hypothetical protein|nr:DUF2490 domain-containing protein [Cytophagaceae bacterium]
MIKKITFLWFIIFSLTGTIQAQTLTFYGLFPVYNQTGRIYKKLDYSIFLFAALNTFNQKIGGTDYPSKYFLLYDENALIYNLSKQFSVAASYTYQRTDVFLNSYVNEHRIWEQVAFKHFIRKATLKHRLRFDERFIQDRTNNTYPLSHRLRYLIGADLPLSDKYYLTGYNEFFFTTSSPRNAFYGEDWAYIGIGLKTKMGKFEAGPIHITWVRYPAQDRMNLWYLQLSWMTTINLTKDNNKQ